MIEINLEKAKNICKDKIRADRIPLLEQLDVLFLRALESNNIQQKNKIINKKQFLRDLTDSPQIKNAKNIQDLLSFKPLEEFNIYE